MQRPRAYAALRRRERRSPPGDRHPALRESPARHEDTLRPLIASASAGGIMILGILQFVGAAWAALPPEARIEAAIATRVGFIAFLVTLAMLVLAWLVAARVPRLWLAFANALGVLVFAYGAFVIGRGISRALSVAGGTMEALPPGDTQAFLAFAVLSLGALAIWAICAIMLGVFKRRFG